MKTPLLFLAGTLVLAAIPSNAAPPTAARADAAKLAFKNVADFILPNGHYTANFNRATLNRINDLKLTPDIAAVMHPAADATFEQRREYVMVMAELEPPSQHLALIEALATAQPRDYDLAALHLVAVPPARRAPLIQAIARDPDNDLRGLAERLRPLLNPYGAKDPAGYRSLLENWRTVVELFAAIPPAQVANKQLFWFDPINLAFDEVMNIPAFLPPPDSPAPAPELAALATLRNDTLRAVAMAMHPLPTTTRQAFAILHHGRTVLNLDDDALRQLALRSCQLLLRAEDQVCPDPWELGDFVDLRPGRFSETRLELPYNLAGITPYGYLLDQALSTRKFHSPEDFLSCFGPENRRALQAGLDFFAKPTAAQATALLPAVTAPDEPIPAPALALPAALAGLCGIDLAQGFTTLLAATETADPDERQDQQIQLLALWANINLEQRNITQLTATIREATRRFLGPTAVPDPRAEPAEAIGALVYRIHPPPDDCALFRVLLANARPELTSQVVPHLIGLPETPADSARVLLGSRLFHPGPGMFVRSTEFLPCAVIGFGPDRESSFGELGRELLKTDGPERFWARLAGACLAKTDASVAAAELTRELAAIKAWPAPEQRDLAKFLLARWPELNAGPLAPWFTQATHTPPPDLAVCRQQLMELTEPLAYQYCDTEPAEKILAPLIATDPAAAARLWLEVLAAAAKLPARPHSQLPPAEAVARANRMVFVTINEQTPEPAALLKFLLAIRERLEPGAMEGLNDPIHGVGCRVLQSSLPASQLPAGLESLATMPLGSLAALLDAYRTCGEATTVSLAFPLLASELGSHEADPKLIELLENWVRQDLAPQRPLLAKAARIGILLVRGYQQDPAQATELRTLVLDWLRLKQATPPQQLTLLKPLINSHFALMQHPDCAAAIVEVIRRPELESATFREAKADLLLHLRDNSAVTPVLAEICCTQLLPPLVANFLADPELLPERWSIALVQSWFALAVTAARPEFFAQALATMPDKFRADSGLITWLAEQGWQSSAALLAPLPGIVTRPQSRWSPKTTAIFTAAFERNLPDLLMAIPDPHQRYRMEVMLANLDDAKVEQAPTLPRARRLLQLANRFAAEAPPEPLVRTQLLAIVGAGDRDQNLAEMLQLMAAITALPEKIEISPPTYFDEHQHAIATAQADLVTTTVNAALRAGQPELWLNHLAAAIADDSPAPKQRDLAELLTRHWAAHVNFILHLPPDQREAAARKAIALTDAIHQQRAKDQPAILTETALTYSMMAHLIGGISNEFEARWRTRARRTAGYPETYLYPRWLIWGSGGFVNPDGASSLPQLITAILTDPIVGRILLPAADDLRWWQLAGLVNPENLPTLLQTVPDTCPRQPEFLIYRADHDREAAENHAAALKTYEHAAALATTQNQPAFIALATARQVRSLHAAGKSAEAAKLATTVDVTQLTEHERTEFSSLTKALTATGEP